MERQRARDSIRHYVGPSVGRSVGRSVITSHFWAFRAKRRADFSYCPCLATILPLPTRTRLMLPCIRPCFSSLLHSFHVKLHFQRNRGKNKQSTNTKLKFFAISYPTILSLPSGVPLPHFLLCLSTDFNGFSEYENSRAWK